MRRAVVVDQRAREQADLCRAQARELAQLEQEHVKRRAALEQKLSEELQQRKVEHVRQLVDLWQRQGRKLGPWAEPVLEGQAPAGSNAEGKVGHG